MEHYEITLAEYWRILRKRRTTILFVFAAVMFSTFIFTKMQTPVYESSLELKVERQNPIIAINTGESNAAIDSGGAMNLATEIRLITSKPILEKVVERIEVLPVEKEARIKAIHEKSLAYQNRIRAEQINDTNIISVRATANDPQTAALMATAVADVYVVENVEGRKKQSRAQINYIEQQLDEYRRQLANYEAQLQKFKQNEKVFEVTPEVKETLDRMTVEGTFEFEAEMLQIDRQLRHLTGLMEEREGSRAMRLLDSDSLDENYIFVGLKRRLLELEFERFLLLIDYTERHPAVIEKDKVIADVKNKIVDMLKSFSPVSITPEMEADLALIIKNIFLETRQEVLYRIVNKFYGDSGSLSSNQLEYVELKRSIDRLLNSYDTLIRQRDEIRLNLAKVIDDVVTIVSPASVPSHPIKPNARVNYLVSSALGLLLGILFAFLRESVDASVSTIADVEHDLKLSILGIVPHMKREEVMGAIKEPDPRIDKKLQLQRARLVTITAPKSWPAESIKMLRTNLMQLMKSKQLKTILFTSSDKQEGKSTVVTNVALSMAQLGKKTVLVGSNLRRPTAYKIFGLEREPGLSDILMGNVDWKDAVNKSVDILTGGIDVDFLLQMPGIGNLEIITCGRAVDNVSELINSQSYDKLLSDLKNHYDVIIIDCSPVMAVPDAITLSDKVDGVALVYKVGYTAKDVLKRAKSNLENAGAQILGIVMNDIRTEAQVGYSAYYYRYYADTPDEKQNMFKRWMAQKRNQDKSKAS